MNTYQDLLAAGEDDAKRGQFCIDSVRMFMSSKSYKDAQAGEAYYSKHNLTIEQYQKFLYTLSGRKVKDIYSADYKLKTLFFRRLVIQQVQYVLGNGCTLSENASNKEKLGKDFDFKLQMAAKRAMAGGQAFGFWNYDHLEVFGYADTPSEPGFCPLYDEDTGELKAGIRFWSKQIGNVNVAYYVLYEEDGVTEFMKKGSEDIRVSAEKTAYKTKIVRSEGVGVEKVVGENYGSLPIVPLYANDTHESELVGIRESIDCYDFIKSGLANAIDDTAEIYWIIKNAGGMGDTDVARLFERLRTMHGAVTEDDDELVPHTVEVPTEARKLMLELLRKDIYEDFQALDVNTLSAAQKTTQEIQAAYQAQDNKCADFEYFILDFVQQILELAGIQDNPVFVWNRVVNQAEQTNMVLSAATFLTDEMIIKKLPFLTPEEADAVIQEREMGSYNAFNQVGARAGAAE